MEQACARLAEGDSIILIGDGVYASGTPSASISVMADDLRIRGVTSEHTEIDYARLVELCASHTPVVSWR